MVVGENEQGKQLSPQQQQQEPHHRLRKKRRTLLLPESLQSSSPHQEEEILDDHTILPHLLLCAVGDPLLEDTEDLLQRDITYLVDCGGGEEKKTAYQQWRSNHHLSPTNGFTVAVLDLSDESTEDLTDAFEKAFPLMRRAKRENKKCLVYCRFGMSRSVSVVVAYLMAFEKMTLLEAIAFVKKHRRIASPNPGFMEQLLTLERAVDRKRGGDGSTIPTLDINLYRNDRFGEPDDFAYDIDTNRAEDDSKRAKDRARVIGHNRDASATSLLLPLLKSSLTEDSSGASAVTETALAEHGSIDNYLPFAFCMEGTDYYSNALAILSCGELDARQATIIEHNKPASDVGEVWTGTQIGVLLEGGDLGNRRGPTSPSPQTPNRNIAAFQFGSSFSSGDGETEE